LRRTVLGLALLSVALLVGCQESGRGLLVSDVRVGAPAGPNAALYFTVTNRGDEPDRLVGATTDVAERVEIHETTMDDDGTMRMQAVAGVDAPINQTVALEPGGLHVMLVGVERLDEGESVDVTLQWEVAGDLDVVAEVVAPAETMADDHGQ